MSESTESETTAVVKAEAKPDLSIQQFGTRDDVVALGKRIKAMMPGGARLKDADAMAAAQYALAIGANPFRGEIYAWENQGHLQLAEGYKLLVRWAKRQMSYSEKYELLNETEDMKDGDIGYRCWILRHDSMDLLKTLLQTGMSAREAFEMAATSAGGVVRAAEMSGNAQPPKGWTWHDVAQKRALKNALKRSHGAPSPAEIARESWHVGETSTKPEDWREVTAEMSPDEAEAIARYNARERERQERPRPQISATEAVADLFGDDAATEFAKGVAPQETITEGETLPPHQWTDDELSDFRSWYLNKMVIEDRQALEALGVSRIRDFPGDVETAQSTVHTWLDAQIETANAEMEIVDVPA